MYNMEAIAPPTIREADETWIATALLHREHPDRADFTIQEITARAARENLAGRLREGIKVHVSLHCVANKAPNPARHRMLYATGRHTRRLYHPGDLCHPGRTGKTKPNREDIPPRCHELLDWYDAGCEASPARAKPDTDPLLALWGLGSEIWQDVDPDEYVRSLREGWD
jgi:hypothetical protein